ncbi:HTH-type transcriptional regulator RutR [Nocardia otitidiscaviarum]|uniref:HTH-type transcriptional regulator RutR n=1 Tax=Nocardia otitidiscaviarum TaxID=1823 RepID=A0A379JJN2_9NOCA|nr:TetR family transcriptional regulator [Nocardia otitidiscaviarum]SUD48596.1 HTH-type transcriptional regulator RutR [Nocardia otitidiscaviarum]
MRAAGHATRERILAAAKAEFATYGVAGARINRIATAARASKDRLYAYFASKDELYAAVTEQWAAQTTADTALNADDLPGYTGRLFDHYLDHPENARLQTWAEIEQTHIPEAEAAVRRVLAGKIAEIERGQRDGVVTTDFQPVALVVMLTDVARTAAVHAARAGQPHDIAARRAAVVLAARRLIAPAAS